MVFNDLQTFEKCSCVEPLHPLIMETNTFLRLLKIPQIHYGGTPPLTRKTYR